MRFDEQEAVRVTRALSGDDPYGGGFVSVPAGELGAVVASFDDACDVEFFLHRPSGAGYNAILTISNADLEPAA